MQQELLRYYGNEIGRIRRYHGNPICNNTDTGDIPVISLCRLKPNSVTNYLYDVQISVNKTALNRKESENFCQKENLNRCNTSL
jgi:hypothetical protein